MADDLMKSLLGGSDDDEGQGGLGGLLGGAGGGALGGMLDAVTGSGGDIGSMLSGLTDMSADKLESLPVAGDIVKELAGKLGIPTAQAAALVSSAIAMLVAKMNQSGTKNLNDLDLDDLADMAEESDVLSEAVEKTGMDMDQVTEGVQEAIKLIVK